MQIDKNFIAEFRELCSRHDLNLDDPLEVMSCVEKIFQVHLVSFCQICLAVDEGFDTDNFLASLLAELESSVASKIALGG